MSWLCYACMQVNGGHQETSEGVLHDYCDGKRFKEHLLFSTKPTALQLILYYDDVELCNPLGSRRKKYKIGNYDWVCKSLAILDR